MNHADIDADLAKDVETKRKATNAIADLTASIAHLDRQILSLTGTIKRCDERIDANLERRSAADRGELDAAAKRALSTKPYNAVAD